MYRKGEGVDIPLVVATTFSVVADGLCVPIVLGPRWRMVFYASQ